MTNTKLFLKTLYARLVLLCMSRNQLNLPNLKGFFLLFPGLKKNRKMNPIVKGRLNRSDICVKYFCPFYSCSVLVGYRTFVHTVSGIYLPLFTFLQP